MLNLQRQIAFLTISASMLPLLQQVLSELVSGQRALLILNSANLWIVHRGQIELDEFLTDGDYRTESDETTRPGERISQTAFERRWQPSLLLIAPVVKSGLPIAGCALTAISPDCSSAIQALFNGMPTMGEFSGKDDFTCRIVDNGYAGRFAAWVELEMQGFKLGMLERSLQDEREWVAFEHGGFASREQDTRSAWMNGIQWLFVGIEDKNVAQDEPPIARVMVALTMFVKGLTCKTLA